MLTRLTVRNFKLFEEVDLELGPVVVFIGPNNAGKTTALQALALWEIGVRRWLEKRGAGEGPLKRPGVTINRRDLIALPVPTANLLWHGLHTRSSRREHNKTRTENVLTDVVVDGVDWTCGMEFDYANSESFYCRPLLGENGKRVPVPPAAGNVRIAYLPPMSGLAANETRLDPGAIDVRLGEGRTAEVLRNLCYSIYTGEDGGAKWERLVERIASLFGSRLEEPNYIAERGEITLTYRNRHNVRLDLSASGRGEQQTLLLLAHMTANPGSVLLLDEPDAHLEILRQRQTYHVLTEVAEETQGQIIAASHSEVVLNEAAGRDVLIAFVGRPHRIDGRGSQLAKSLKEIGFEHHMQAEMLGWVLYLEGSTDLAILRAFAKHIDHPAQHVLAAPFVHYVANQPGKAREHFYGVLEGKRDLIGLAIYDRLHMVPEADAKLSHLCWRRTEIENYVCRREALIALAESEGAQHRGALFGIPWRQTMSDAIDEVESALEVLGEPTPWGPDGKASAFLDLVFRRFYERSEAMALIRKSDYHRLVSFVDGADVDTEVTEKLDAIVDVAGRAQPRVQQM
ncbi:MAG: AAA family ATPase [Candidatus Tectomicrobia bacterium]|nr:AAA family ATPase [Candidatus Tectomicrobia bacterium]